MDNANCLWPLADCSIVDESARVIATLSHRDFSHLRKHARDFERWRSYEDFRLERDCEFLCACSAGLPARQQRAPLSLFRAWSRLTGASMTLDRLDDFALRWRVRRMRADIRLAGLLTRDPDAVAPILVSDALVIPIARHAFEAWIDALSSLPAVTSGSTLDHYVQLAAEAALPSRSKGVLR